MSSNVLQLTAANFDAEVLASPVPALVYFKANWCGPCTVLTPIIERFADEYVGRVKVCALDVDVHPAIAHRYIENNIPICIVFKDGENSGHHAGIASRDRLIALLGL